MSKDESTGKRCTGPWNDRVEVRADAAGQGYAFVPGQVVLAVPDDATYERIVSERQGRSGSLRRGSGRWALIEGADDARAEAEFWTRLGITAQPNHVLFADAGEVHANPAATAFATGATFANPFAAGATFANPWAAGATFANPWAAGATFANPWAAGATFANPWGAGGIPCLVPVPCCPPKSGCEPSTPEPAQAPTKNLAVPAAAVRQRGALKGAKVCRVVVLDTGLSASDYLPDGLSADASLSVGVASASGEPPTDEPDEEGNDVLDPVAGHGTFIAGLIKRIAPEAKVKVVRVLSTFGEGNDENIAATIDKVVGGRDTIDILSLSFSGYTRDDRPPICLADAIGRFVGAGGVVVASAGNDATCRIAFPAGLPSVVSVAALGPNGPAPFTNYGSWVRACAPGQDVVSQYYQHRPESAADDMDAIEGFAGWASWSGTSFSAPIVAGVIARSVSRENLRPHAAMQRCIDDPHLLRLPALGTVINEH